MGTAQKKNYGALLWRKMSKISTPINSWFNDHHPKKPSSMYLNYNPPKRRLHMIIRPHDYPLKKHGLKPFEQEIMIPGQGSMPNMSTNTSQKLMRHKKGIWRSNPRASAPPIQRNPKPPPEPHKKQHEIFIKVVDLKEIMYSDQTGKFPYLSNKGMRYTMMA